MAKKIIESGQRKIRTRNQCQELTNKELKTMAIKKVRQLQNGKKSQSKISKRSFEHNINNRQQTRVQKQLFEQILDQSVFQCPVCLQLMIQPTLLECGHAYCFKCLEELMIYKSCCGVCRNVQTQSQFQRSKHLQTMIESMILKKSQNYLDYYCRLTDIQNWKRMRNITIQQLTKGVFIDFRDKQLKWRKAQIIKLSYNEITCQYDIIVKYKKDGQPTEQMIQSNSGRYTKFSYYTRMKYLQPKNNCNSILMEQFAEGQVMDIPFVDVEGMSLNYDDIDIMGQVGLGNGDDSDNHSHSSNIMLSQHHHYQQTQFQNNNPNIEQDNYLDELFNNNNNQMQPIDLIELLA